jgi:hypothetical protein
MTQAIGFAEVVYAHYAFSALHAWTILFVKYHWLPFLALNLIACLFFARARPSFGWGFAVCSIAVASLVMVFGIIALVLPFAVVYK